MLIRIPIPKGVGPYDIRRLRPFAAWYLRQVAKHGPGYGAKRAARQSRRRGSTIREGDLTLA